MDRHYITESDIGKRICFTADSKLLSCKEVVNKTGILTRIYRGSSTTELDLAVIAYVDGTYTSKSGPLSDTILVE